MRDLRRWDAVGTWYGFIYLGWILDESGTDEVE